MISDSLMPTGSENYYSYFRGDKNEISDFSPYRTIVYLQIIV